MPKQPPQARLDNLPREYVSETVESLAQLHSMGRVRTDAECASRISQYFRFCSQSGLRPGIEGLCLAMGITRQTLMRWTQGVDCTPERKQLIESARQYIAAFLEQVLISGKGSTVGAIFAAKNWLGYADTYTLETSHSTQLYEGMTPEEVARQIELDIPIDAPQSENAPD